MTSIVPQNSFVRVKVLKDFSRSPEGNRDVFCFEKDEKFDALYLSFSNNIVIIEITNGFKKGIFEFSREEVEIWTKLNF